MADPHWSNVSLLLHCDGSNGSTVFTDSSASAVTVSAVSGAQISTAQSRFGGSSAAFNGIGSHLSVSSSGLDFGSGDLTIEGWVYPTGSGSTLINCQSSTNLVNLYLDSSTSARLILNNTNRITSISLSASSWQHVAITRNGNLWTVWVGGSSAGTATVSGSFNCTNSSIGGYAAGHYFSGHLDDIRITKGVARYTASFTPPTAPFDHGDSGVSGSISSTLASVSGSLAGSVGAAGSLSATLAALSGSISALHVQPVTGTISGTLANLTGSMAGTHAPPVTGTISAAMANLTGSLEGSFGIDGFYGALGGTLAGVSGYFSGAHLQRVTGTLSGHLANLTGSVHATTGESHRIRRGPWLRIRSEPNLVLLSCDDDDSGLNHSVVVSVGNINRPGDGSETGSVRVDLDNYDGRVSRLLAIPPLGVRASLYGPTGDPWFDGTLASVNLSETAALQLEA